MLGLERSLQRSSAGVVALVAAGTALVAATYGMARFGVGLLHPATAAQRPELASALGAAGAAQFGSYCLAAVVAAFLVPRRSRLVAGAAGAVAGAGCVGIALSSSPWWYVVSAFVAGAGAGLASPALVGLLDALVPARMASAAQAVVNSGTSIGVVGAGVLAGAVQSPGVAWPSMAGLCLVTGAAVVLTSGGRPVEAPVEARAGALPVGRPAALASPTSLGLPTVAALGAGVVSAATWTYGPTAVVSRGALEADQVGLLWVALGLGGLAGAFVDRPVARLGAARTFAFCTGTLVVASVAVLAPVSDGAWSPLVGAACFGAAYMAMSGVLILWSRLLDPERGAALTAWLFVALAVGQAAGAQLLGPVVT